MIKEAIFHDYEMSETFNNYFENIVKHMKTIPNENFETALLNMRQKIQCKMQSTKINLV